MLLLEGRVTTMTLVGRSFLFFGAVGGEDCVPGGVGGFSAEADLWNTRSSDELEFLLLDSSLDPSMPGVTTTEGGVEGGGLVGSGQDGTLPGIHVLSESSLKVSQSFGDSLTDAALGLRVLRRPKSLELLCSDFSFSFSLSFSLSVLILSISS